MIDYGGQHMDSLYFARLKVNSAEAVIDKFYDTLIDTDRGYNFFVDFIGFFNIIPSTNLR